MRISNRFFTAVTATLLSISLSVPVLAEEGGPLLDKNKFSIGAGLSINSISGPIDDELGLQVFAGYDLSQVKLMEGAHSSVEFGIMDYGFNSDSTGIWGTYVIDGKLGGQFGWLARLGIDLGDDSGLMLGAGAGYSINKRLDLRLEYVIRDDVDSLQFNAVYRL